MERRLCQGSEGTARRACAALCVLALAISPDRAHAELDKGTQDELRAVLTALPHARTVAGACVIDIQSGRTVFTLNADEALIPASAMKVFTMATALDVLGPGCPTASIGATFFFHRRCMMRRFVPGGVKVVCAPQVVMPEA